MSLPYKQLEQRIHPSECSKANNTHSRTDCLKEPNLKNQQQSVTERQQQVE